MTDLVACLGAGKGTWTDVLKLVKKPEFENVFLVVNQWTRDKLQLEREKLNMVVVNSDDSHTLMRDKIIAGLKGKTRGFEVALNLESGTGKEHSAVISALIKLGLAFRIIIPENDSFTDLTEEYPAVTE